MPPQVHIQVLQLAPVGLLPLSLREDLPEPSLHPPVLHSACRACCSLTRSMTARARELALCVPVVAPSVDPNARSDLCLSPPILSPPSPRRPPEPDATIRLGPKFQVSTMPAYQGSCCTDACERGDQLLSLAEVELALARTTACRITAAAFHEPGVRLDLVKGEWLSVPRRRRQQPRCRTFGCSLPDLHAGLHQVARAPSPPHPPQKPDRPHAPRRWPARSASGGWAPDAGLMRWRCGARRWRALPSPCMGRSSVREDKREQALLTPPSRSHLCLCVSSSSIQFARRVSCKFPYRRTIEMCEHSQYAAINPPNQSASWGRRPGGAGPAPRARVVMYQTLSDNMSWTNIRKICS